MKAVKSCEIAFYKGPHISGECIVEQVYSAHVLEQLL